MTLATVSAVEAKKTQSGKAYWRVQLDGVGWASTWDVAVAKLCEARKGQELDIETEKTGDQGQFTNIKTAKLPPATGAGAPSSRDALIVREVALKAAVERFAGVQASDADVVSTASAYVAWLLGEAEPPEPFDPDSIPA